MPAQLIDGNALARSIRAEVAQRAASLTAGGCRPGLAVILVGENPASMVYVRHKVKDCEDSGLRSVLERYDTSIGEETLLARVRALNADPSIHGILVQLPLPPHIDTNKVIEAISPSKDVDGFHLVNAGALMIGLTLTHLVRVHLVLAFLALASLISSWVARASARTCKSSCSDSASRALRA